jgi:hypothetical protein
MSAFRKQKLTFGSHDIFGRNYKNNLTYAFNQVSKMLFNNKANVDGSIGLEQTGNFTKAELWGYIYYLFYYNSSNIDEFKNMKSKNGKANAELFYSVVKSFAISQLYNLRQDETAKPGEIQSIDINDLIFFINNIVHKYGEELVSPIFDYLQLLVKKDVSTKLKGIKIRTGLEGSNVKIVVDEKEVENANIKISFFPQNTKT